MIHLLCSLLDSAHLLQSRNAPILNPRTCPVSLNGRTGTYRRKWTLIVVHFGQKVLFNLLAQIANCWRFEFAVRVSRRVAVTYTEGVSGVQLPTEDKQVRKILWTRKAPAWIRTVLCAFDKPCLCMNIHYYASRLMVGCSARYAARTALPV